MKKQASSTVIINFDRQTLVFFVYLFFLAFIVWALLKIFPYSGIIFYPLLISMMLAIITNPFVMKLEKIGFSRTMATVVIVFLLLALFVSLVFFLIPVVEKQLNEIISFVQQTSPDELRVKVITFLKKNLGFIKSDFRQVVAEKIVVLYSNFLQNSFLLIPSLINFLIMLVLIPFITFFILKDGRKFKKALIEKIPNRFFEPAINLFYKVNSQISNYFISQLLVAFCVGFLSFILLLLFKVPYAAFIALVAGVFNIIPYLGPVSGGLLAAGINYFSKGTIGAVIDVALIFVLVRMADDFIFTPNIMSKGVKLYPLLVIAAIFIGGEMYGFWGLLLAIPVVAVLKVIISEVFISLKRYHL